MRGIYNTTSDPEFRCSSRCFWKESYISFGFLSHCQNLTASTLASNPNTTMNVHADGSRVIFNLTTPGSMTFEMVMVTMYRTQIKIAANDLRP
jgi:hypothetical protein